MVTKVVRPAISSCLGVVPCDFSLKISLGLGSFVLIQKPSLLFRLLQYKTAFEQKEGKLESLIE